VPAFVWKGCVHGQAGLGMDAWLGCRGFEYGQKQILGLRMGDCTGYFTLFATDAALRVNENSFHMPVPFYWQNAKQSPGKMLFPIINLLPTPEREPIFPTIPRAVTRVPAFGAGKLRFFTRRNAQFVTVGII
jgi:hypothetical protein